MLQPAQARNTSGFAVRRKSVCTSSSEGVKVTFVCDGSSMTWRQILSLWKTDGDFNRFFSDALAEVAFPDFFMETMPIRGEGGLDGVFECVLLDAGGVLIARRASHAAFDEHLSATTAKVIQFSNIGGDAVLVVPRPSDTVNRKVFGHLATFLRNASEDLRSGLWQKVSQAVHDTLKDAPRSLILINTDGRGVPWLHVRLDSTPKYIKYLPYTRCMRLVSGC